MSEVSPYKYGEPWHDYSLFTGCFGDTRIMPTDVDGIVERRGKFLVIEYKSGDTAIPRGQTVLLKRLSLLPAFTVIAIWREPCEPHATKTPIRIQVFPANDSEPTDTDYVRHFVKEWFSAADERREMVT